MMGLLKKLFNRLPTIHALENSHNVQASEKDTTNEGRKLGDSLPLKEWLMDKIPHEDILNGLIYENTLLESPNILSSGPTWVRKNPRYNVLPSSASASKEWIQFQKNIQPNDEVWTFSSTITKIPSPFHWAGVCLIREGEIVDHVMEEMHISYRKHPSR